MSEISSEKWYAYSDCSDSEYDNNDTIKLSIPTSSGEIEKSLIDKNTKIVADPVFIQKLKNLFNMVCMKKKDILFGSKNEKLFEIKDLKRLAKEVKQTRQLNKILSKRIFCDSKPKKLKSLKIENTTYYAYVPKDRL